MVRQEIGQIAKNYAVFFKKRQFLFFLKFLDFTVFRHFRNCSFKRSLNLRLLVSCKRIYKFTFDHFSLDEFHIILHFNVNYYQNFKFYFHCIFNRLKIL